MSLMKIEAELREVEAEILNCYDINTGEEMEDPSLLEEHRLVLYNAVMAKRNQYAKIIKDGFFKRMHDKIDNKVKALKREKDDLKFREERIQQVLHEHIVKEGKQYDTVIGADGKPELYITPSYSVTRSVNINEVEGSYLKVKLPTLSYYDIDYIIDKLRNTDDPVAFKIIQELESNMQKTCNVSDLPEGHKAIRSTIRPTIKTTIGKPKHETKDTIHS